MLLVRPWVSIRARLAAFFVFGNSSARNLWDRSLGRPGGTTAPMHGRPYRYLHCFEWRQRGLEWLHRRHGRLVFGFFLVVSLWATAQAQSPKDTAVQKHSPRQDRLAALGLLTAPLEDEKVIKALSDSDWYIRGEAALAAAKLGTKIPAKEITPLLADSNWFVRSAALEALTASGDASAGPALQHLLDPEEPFLCSRAAALLGEIKYLAAEEPLIRMLSEGDDQVKRAA